MNCISCLFICSMKQKYNNKDNNKDIVIPNYKTKIPNNFSFLRRETIAVSSEYSELKYWFSELIKYIIEDYNNYENKEKLLKTVWKYVDITDVSRYYDVYKSNYLGEYSEKYMLDFYKTMKGVPPLKDEEIKFAEFENNILCVSKIYRVSGFT